MAFNKEIAKTANKVYTNGKGMYMLLFNTYSVITSGNEDGPTDGVYLRTESANPVGAPWVEASTSNPVSLAIKAGPSAIKFTGLSKYPEGTIYLDKGKSIELSVQPQPADTTDYVTYSWGVDGAYLSYSQNDNKCTITGTGLGTTTVTVTPVVNGTADASKAVSFATKVIPVLTVNVTSTPVQSWRVNSTINDVNLVNLCNIKTSEGSSPVFRASNLPEGLYLSSSGIISGTPMSMSNGGFQVTVYIAGFEDETAKQITVNYAIAEEAPTLSYITTNITMPEMTAGTEIQSYSIIDACQLSTSTGVPIVFDTVSALPSGLFFDNGIITGTPNEATSGSAEFYAYPQGYYNNGVRIYVSYTVKAAAQKAADYIVSGATSYPDVNGEYNESGTANGKPKYVNTVNSNAYIQCDNILGWAVCYYSQPRYYTNDTSSATPPTSATWKQGNEIITVAKGGSSSGGESDGATKVIITGEGYAITGTFVDNGNGTYVREDGSYCLEWGDFPYDAWCIFSYPSRDYLYTSIGGTQGDVTSIEGDHNPWWNHEASNYPINITVVKGGASNPDSPSEPSETSKVTVSGFSSVYYNYMDGEYTYDSSNDYYINSSNYKLKWVEPGSGYDYNPSTAQWCIIDSGMTVMAFLGGTKGDVNSIAGTNTYYITVDPGYMPSVTITVGGGSDSGDSSGSATTVNISGAIQSRFDGDYVYNASNNRYDQSNSVMWTRYIEWVSSRNAWCIVENQNGYDLYTDLGGTEGDISSITGTKSVMINGEPIDGCTITITVTEGTGESGRDEGTTEYWEVTGAGASFVDGKYYLTDSSNVYKHESSNYYIWLDAGTTWWLTNEPNSWAQDFYYWDTNISYVGYGMYADMSGYGTAPTVKFVKGGDGGNGDSSDGVVAYKVTCDGFTGEFAKYAGTYTQINAPATGTEALYKNENNCYMRWWNDTWGWSFNDVETPGRFDNAVIVTYETSDNPVNATNKGSWWNEYSFANIPPGKIELGSGGADGGDTGPLTVVITPTGYAIGGTFVDDGTGKYVREDGTYYLEWSDSYNGWLMLDIYNSFSYGYANFGGTKGDITSIAGTHNPYWSHEASNYQVTITVSGGSGIKL